MVMNNVEKFVLAFVMVLIGSVLLSVVAANSLAVTTETTKTENIDIGGARLAGGALLSTWQFNLSTGAINNWRSETADCIPQTIIFKNSTGATMASTTNYVYTPSTGALRLVNAPPLNNTNASNSTTATYDYCADGYISSSFGRSSTNMIAGFFAIAILGIGLGLFYSIGKDTGIID